MLPSGLSGEELKMETHPLSSRAPSPALPSAVPGTLRLLWTSLAHFPRPRSLCPTPRAHSRAHTTQKAKILGLHVQRPTQEMEG